MRNGLTNWPIISQLIQELQNAGNAVPKCPIRPGNYFVENFPVERSPLLNFFPTGKYLLNMKFSDENRKPLDILKLEIVIEKL
jgi:Protein of unknown function (DUF1091)